MSTLDLLNQHIPCWTIAHTPLGADVYRPGCTCGWEGTPCGSDNETLDQHQAHLAREIDRQRPVADRDHSDLVDAWRDVVDDWVVGRIHVTVSSIDADTHWCRLHRLMQAHTKEAES